jgi:hypothetical protein
VRQVEGGGSTRAAAFSFEDTGGYVIKRAAPRKAHPSPLPWLIGCGVGVVLVVLLVLGVVLLRSGGKSVEVRAKKRVTGASAPLLYTTVLPVLRRTATWVPAVLSSNCSSQIVSTLPHVQQRDMGSPTVGHAFPLLLLLLNTSGCDPLVLLGTGPQS